MDKIDFVIYWVDAGDKEWQKKKAQYDLSTKEDGADNRYRDWDNLYFLFRGIEKFAPWVNHVYFISDNQIPQWMNVKHPKLRIVSHDEYIPSEYLPVFSSHPIEMNFHRLPGISEKFVVFNDDFFITDYIEPSDFFVNGLPKDIFMEYPIMCGGNNPTFASILTNTFNLIGKHFDRKEYKKRLRKQILSTKYGSYFFYNLIMYILPFPRFFGMLTPHFARPYLKSTFEELWEKEPDILKNTCRSRFRNSQDVNIYAFRLWNMLQGKFVPGNIFKMGRAFFIHDNNEEIYQSISSQKYKLICLNDDCDDETFKVAKERIIEEFVKILPEKSKYEL